MHIRKFRKNDNNSFGSHVDLKIYESLNEQEKVKDYRYDLKKNDLILESSNSIRIFRQISIGKNRIYYEDKIMHNRLKVQQIIDKYNNYLHIMNPYSMDYLDDVLKANDEVNFGIVLDKYKSSIMNKRRVFISATNPNGLSRSTHSLLVDMELIAKYFSLEKKLIIPYFDLDLTTSMYSNKRTEKLVRLTLIEFEYLVYLVIRDFEYAAAFHFPLN